MNVSLIPIKHHGEISKLEYSIDTKKDNFSQILSKDLKLLIEKTLNDLSPEINKLVLEKTEQYIKNHKNLQLKLINIQKKIWKFCQKRKKKQSL